jgi:hypothetical protein
MNKENIEFIARIEWADKSYDTRATIIFGSSTSQEILIHLHLDEMDICPPELPRILKLSSLSLDSNGNTTYSINATPTFNIHSRWSQNHNTGVGKHTVVTRPESLETTQFIPGERDSDDEQFCYFWITDSKLLSLGNNFRTNCDGTIEILFKAEFFLELIPDINFIFTEYYSFSKPSDENIRTIRSCLMAKFEGKTERDLGLNLLPDIDILLSLVSFSARRRIMCWGYKILVENELSEFYRNNISVPSKEEDKSINSMLLHGENFHDFLKKTWKSVIDSRIFFENEIEKAIAAISILEVYSVVVLSILLEWILGFFEVIEVVAKIFCDVYSYLFEAISKIVPKTNSTIESEYLRYYSALENLINAHRKLADISFILDEQSWIKFEKHLKASIKSYDILSNSPKKRNLIYQKLKELNRVSFNTAFNSFLEEYTVEIGDLCPLEKLSAIRNRIVHGEVLDSEKLDLIVFALYHLQWTVERCLLRFLDWEIERSHVSSSHLQHTQQTYIDREHGLNMINEIY